MRRLLWRVKTDFQNPQMRSYRSPLVGVVIQYRRGTVPTCAEYFAGMMLVDLSTLNVGTGHTQRIVVSGVSRSFNAPFRMPYSIHLFRSIRLSLCYRQGLNNPAKFPRSPRESRLALCQGASRIGVARTSTSFRSTNTFRLVSARAATHRLNQVLHAGLALVR